MTNALMAPNNDPNQNSNNNTKTNSKRVKFGQLLCSSEPNVLSPLLDVENDDVNCSGSGSGGSSCRLSNASDCYTSSPRISCDENPTASPFYYAVSPFSQTDYSPYIKSPWIKLTPSKLSINHHSSSTDSSVYYSRGRNCLIGSLVREEGHVYSLAVHGGTLYAGSESKNIRVWKDFHDVGGFKCGSGLVKAIVVSSTNGKVFTGHQDGKIRIWSEAGKRVGSLPKLKDFIKSSINPKNYVEVRRHHKVPRIKHYDAVSCMSLNEESGLLYSASWDKTIKVWRISDGKCLESIEAHSDAINSIVVGFGGLVISGSADGTVKVWRRELMGRTTRHFHVKTLLSQENAVTSLAVSMDGGDEGEMEVMYSGSSDGLVNFWVREKEEVVYGGVLRGHKLAVLCLATAGCLVFSGSADKSICVWRREDGGGDGGAHSCLAVLTGHSGPVKCLAVEKDHDSDNSDSDDGRDDHHDHHHHGSRQWIVYSGSLDKSVRIWRVSEYAPEVDESLKDY